LGLVSTEVWVGLNGSSIKHFEEKGYEIPRYKNKNSKLCVKEHTKILVKIKDLSEHSNVKVDVECDGCGKKLKNVVWQDYLKRIVKNDGKYYCLQCATKDNGIQTRLKENEIRNIVDEKLGKDWIIEKIEIIKNNTFITLIDPDGYWYSNVKTRVIKRDIFPRKFHLQNIYAKQNVNNWFKLNNLNMKLIEEYKGTTKKVKIKCLECNNSFKRSFDSIKSGITSCPNCSDGISYPEKLGNSFFNQIGINYIYNSKLKWSENKKYDFTCEGFKIVVEMHGLQHYEETNWGNTGARTLKEEQESDRLKKELAEKNGYKYIEIDCRKSDLDWIKNSIMNSELANIFDLSKINWLQCHEYACSSLVKVACDLWNNCVENTMKIGEIMQLHNSTISKYLKQGVKLGWCDYNVKKIKNNNGKKISNFAKIKFSKSVVQLDLNDNFIKEFESGTEAGRQTGIKQATISLCCRKAPHAKTAGGYKWMFKNDYNLIS